MTTSDNVRLQANERAAIEAEQAFAREEQALWSRLEAALVANGNQRSGVLASRLSMLANLPDAPAPLLARAQELATNHPVTATAMAAAERESALAARQAALQMRQLALQAFARDVAVLEGARAARTRELDELDSLLLRIETEARQAEAARLAAEKKAQEEAARLAAERAAAELAQKQAVEEAARAAWVREQAQMLETMPAMPAFDPAATVTAPEVPAVPAPEEAKTVVEMPAVVAAPIASPAPPPAETASFSAAPAADAPTKTAPFQPPATGRRRASRRRRVRLAPPPRKLQVEVAEYGEDTFYAGWDKKIEDGGLFVVSLETLPPGHELDVEVEVAGKTISARGQVEFVRKDNLANPDCAAGAGIKLLNLSAENAATIESFFATRPPMFFVQP